MTPIALCAALYRVRSRPVHALASGGAIEPVERAASVAMALGWAKRSASIITLTERGADAVRESMAARLAGAPPALGYRHAGSDRVLAEIEARPGAMITTIGRMTYPESRSPNSAVNGMIDRMERRGLVRTECTTKAQEPKGRRPGGGSKIRRVWITELGRLRLATAASQPATA